MVLLEPGLQSSTTCRGHEIAAQVRSQQEMMHFSMEANPVGECNLPLGIQERKRPADAICQMLQARMHAPSDVNLTCLWSK